MREPVFLRKVGVAWYGTPTAVVMYSTFDHLLQGFRIHTVPHGLRQALGKGRGEERVSRTDTPSSFGLLLDIDTVPVEKISRVGLPTPRLMPEGSPC